MKRRQVVAILTAGAIVTGSVAGCGALRAAKMADAAYTASKTQEAAEDYGEYEYTVPEAAADEAEIHAHLLIMRRHIHNNDIGCCRCRFFLH